MKKNNGEQAKAIGLHNTNKPLLLRYIVIFVIGLCLGSVICILFLPRAGLLGSSTIFSPVPSPNSPDMKLVSTFENGQRYKAGAYDVIVVSGTDREMGRQYGSLMKTEINSVYSIIINEGAQQGVTIQQIRNLSHDPELLLPERMKEIFGGMAETSGLTEDDIAIVYYGASFYVSNLTKQNDCSFIATNGNYTTDGSMIVARNYDLLDALSVFDPYYVLVVYKPNDGTNSVATFNPAGMRPETLMNNKGLFISDNNGEESGGPAYQENRPDFISALFRFMLNSSSMSEIDADIEGTRPNDAVIVNAAGPDVAYSYEETVQRLSGVLNPVRRSMSSGLLVATNHFVDPSWGNRIPSPDANSETRYNNLVNQATQNKGGIDAEKMTQIMDIMIDYGGAKMLHTEFWGTPYTTDHQVVYVPQSQLLWIKVSDRSWQNVNLGTLFAN